MSYRAIATDEGISKTSVQCALETFEETDGFRDRSRSGRPKRISERKVQTLKHFAKDDDNRSSARELMAKLNESLDKPIRRRTIINYLQKCGYEYKIKILKKIISKQGTSKSSTSMVFRTFELDC